MFTELNLSNFKCFVETGPVPLRPLTLIFGLNNSGKSSLIKPILLLAQTAAQGRGVSDVITTNGPFANAGTFDDMVSRHVDHCQSFSFGVGISDIQLSHRRERNRQSELNSVSFFVTIRKDPETALSIVSAATTSSSGEVLIDVDRGVSGPVFGEASKDLTEAFQPHFLSFLPYLFPSRDKGQGRPTLDWDRYMLLSEVSEGILNQFGNVQRVKPLRQQIPWTTLLGAASDSGPGAGGEDFVQFMASLDAAGKQDKRAAEIRDWVVNRFKTLNSIGFTKLDRNRTVGKLVGRDRGGASRVNLAGMGEGVGQLLPIVASVVTMNSPGCLIVEQPEIHLHPEAQAHLGDLFVHTVDADRKKQIIVETHSEHLLLRVRRRIAEGSLDPSRVAVLYVERQRRGSTVRSLDLADDASFADWPSGFFDEAYKESLAMVRAIAERRAQHPENQV